MTSNMSDVESRTLYLKEQYKKHWLDKSNWYWFISLVEEVVELGLALVGLHRHTPEYELYQVASIAMNWLEKRGRL